MEIAEPNLVIARQYVEQQPVPGTLIQCGITGSHQYGFPSPDSDLDIKGIHAAHTSDFLGLGPNQALNIGCSLQNRPMTGDFKRE